MDGPPDPGDRAAAAEPARPRRRRGRPRSAAADAPGRTVQALDRALTLLAALARDRGATLSELSERVGIPAPSALRLLTTLERHGFAELDDATQRWAIGVEAYRVGSGFLARTNLVAAAQPTMRRLMRETGETVNLAVADAGEVVFVAQVETHSPIRAFYRLGTRGHMHASGIGKALLAAWPQDEVDGVLRRHGLPRFTARTHADEEALLGDLARSRRRGWAFDDGERYDGMRCVAAAIHGVDGRAVAGVSVSGPDARLDDAAVAAIGERVRAAADAISAAIGGPEAKSGGTVVREDAVD